MLRQRCSSAKHYRQYLRYGACWLHCDLSNTSGLTRTVTADASGRYNASSLPIGTYTVTSGDNKREIV